MSVVAVIPARGGSKGVPGKNVRPVGGVPLIARAVASARAAATIDRVYVSTDDDAIASAARAAGADVVARPADLAGDTASSESALLHALGAIDEHPDVLVFLQATSPFIDPADLDAAVERVRNGDEDVVFSAFETYAFLWSAGTDGATGVNHDHSFRPRRQDREPHFQETGAFYVMRADGFRAAGFRFFGRVGVAVTDERRALEIDSLEQFELAQAIAPLIDGPTSSAAPHAAQDAGIDVDVVVTDFDGVHTDDRALIGVDGEERVTVSRADGMGVRLLREAGVPVLILSTEEHPVVSARAAKLRVEVLQGIGDKAAALAAWLDERGIDPARVAYVGNDVNDLGCLRLVGWPITVPEAHESVRAIARVVLTRPGGNGAVRELADRVLHTRQNRNNS